MTIEALIKAVPPFKAFGGPWKPIETELGTTLPQDYKDFVRPYGAGYFMEFLGVHIPKSKHAT